MKHLLFASFLLTGFLSFGVGNIMAQTGTVKGKVTDAQTKETLPGATVVIEGTALGAAAGVDGNYSIENVPAARYKLTARFIGYQALSRIVEVKGGQTLTEDFLLVPVGYSTSPVVVTAIGTQKTRAEMGTAVSTVQGQSLTMTGVPDISSALAGQAPGLLTTTSNGDPGAATRMVLRGVRSLQGDNQPLIVVDGEPVWNSTIYNQVAVNNNYTNGGPSAYSTLDQINPRDIQSVEVYSGPSAAALWGSSGANGVIVITTKSGSFTPGKKVNISIHESTEMDQLLRPEPLQTEFGQGQNGMYSWNNRLSWGDKISQRSGAPNTVNADGTITSGTPSNPSGGKTSKAVYNHATDVFQSPIFPDYGVTFSGGDQTSNFFLSVDRLGQVGIVKANSNFNRTSIYGNVSHVFNEVLTLRLDATYVNSSTDRTQQGSNLAGLMLGTYRTPPDFNNMPYIVDYVAPNGSVTPNAQRGFRNGNGNPDINGVYDNPFYTIYENPTSFKDSRVIGSVSLAYDPLSWLDFTYRAGIDYLGDRNTSTYGLYDWTVPGGQYSDNLFSQYQINTDLQGRAGHVFSPDFSGSLMLGFHLDQMEYNYLAQIVQTFLFTAPPYYIANGGSVLPPNQNNWIQRDAAAYAVLDLTLYNQIFVNLSGRGESSSTYGPSSAGIYYYPAASVAWQFTKLPALEGSKILNFGKLRVAYGEAGVPPAVYTSQTYILGNPTYYNGWGEAVNPQYWGGGAGYSTTIGNAGIAPEMTTEVEAGADLTLLDNRVTLSATEYYDKTSGAIYGIQVTPSIGFSSKQGNVVNITNIGTEVQANINWIRAGQFSWSSLLNWSTNKNKITSMPEGTQYVALNGFTDPFSAAVLDQPVGVIVGTHWERTGDNGLVTEGKLVLDENGFPQNASTDAVIGNPNPKWIAGIGNTFRYGRFTLNFLFDFRVGGQVWNGTKGALSYFGRYGNQNWWTTITSQQAQTLKDWNGETVADIVTSGSYGNSYVKNADGTYSFRGYVTNFDPSNGAPDVIVDQSWFTSGPGSSLSGGASEQFIEDGSFIRLRQASLSYMLPLTSIGFQSLQISLIGNNLALWTKYTGADPETNLTGPTNGQGLDYFINPSVRTWVLSLQVNY